MDKTILDIKRAKRWNDKDALKRLIDSGMIKPLPKHFKHLMHDPDKCLKCAYDSCGVMGVFYYFRNKLRESL